MNPEIKIKWLDALRSGKYPKGKGRLRKTKTDVNGLENITYCCLGVLCDIIDNTRWNQKDEYNNINGWYLPSEIAISLNIDNHNQSMLSSINDTTETFDDVIKYIEEKM
jgi:hypothetical protein